MSVISAHVTATAIIEDQHIEVESMKVTEELLVQAREYTFNKDQKPAAFTADIISNYFCVRESQDGQEYQELMPFDTDARNGTGKYMDINTFKQ